MTTPDQSAPASPSRRASLFNRMTLIAFLAGATLAGGVAALAGETSMGCWHHGSMLSGNASAADVNAHVDRMLKHLYVEIDATDAQKAQIAPLVKQAVSDLLPLRAQAQAARVQTIDGLTQATIDRAALETARQAHLQLADQASKRFVQLIADVGEVLTPAQRSALAEHLKKMHGMPAG
jgi:Spy/CpxP family protein refolding chaperone